MRSRFMGPSEGRRGKDGATEHGATFDTINGSAVDSVAIQLGIGGETRGI